MTAIRSHEYCVFVFRRGNSFNGMKLNEDGSIIHTIEIDRDIDYNKREYINTNELTIEHKYGEEANEFLKGLGLTEFNGFAPKMVTSEAIGDQVQVPLIELKAKGLSSLPSVNAVLTKIRDGKSLTASDKMLVGPINEYNEFINSDIYLNSNKKDQLFEIWLRDKEETAIKTTRSLIREQAKQVFSVLVGQVWFDDAEDLSDYKKTLTVDNDTVEFTAILSEQTIEL